VPDVGVRRYMGKTLSLPAMRALWRHNLACALIADQMASVGFMDRDTAYTMGVMHDIGRLALAVIRPNEYGQLLETQTALPPASCWPSGTVWLGPLPGRLPPESRIGSCPRSSRRSSPAIMSRARRTTRGAWKL